MAITNYTDLKSTLASYANRSDLTELIPVFIQMCESDMKRRLKTVELESSATVTVTSGVGTLPDDYAGARSVRWDDDTDRALSYITPDEYDARLSAYADGDPLMFTVTGSSLKTLPQDTGSAVMTYAARLTSLSDSSLTNAVITNYPDAYLQGSLKELYHYTRNWPAKQQAADAYEAAMAGVVVDSEQRKYPTALEVRAR